MSPSIRRMIWGAFLGLTLLILAGVIMTLAVLRMEQRQEYQIVQQSRPYLDAVREMDDSLTTMVSATRGYVLTGQTQFTQQYDDAVRSFQKAESQSTELARPRDHPVLDEFREHFSKVKKLTDEQIKLRDDGRPKDAADAMLSTAQLRRAAPDYEGLISDRIRSEQASALDRISSARQWVMITMVVLGLVLIAVSAMTAMRIEQRLGESITRQVRRTEAMIAGMSDGVMLVDGEGKTVFINPAGQRLLGKADIGVPIFRQSEVYRLRDEHARLLDPEELPAAQALSTGRAVHDMTVLIAREDLRVAVSMSATPLHEEGRTSGVVVTFRDITERRALEEQMQLQAERAQILADAGAFFSSNIDPTWVTQAIAERVAEVLGDWSAVILKSSESKELSVASIYHRDMASLGLAWSYIYRQPLVVGEGIIGQVVSTGYPSLTTNIRAAADMTNPGTYHPMPMKLASLLILPLRTRREMLGALIIAANDPDRAMTDDKLPLAEILAERAALAIENAKLYTEQVDARRKVEDLSRLKDEFLSIASHELRTPVTSIKGYTQLAKMLIKEGDLSTSEEYLDIALDQIDRMSRLILELLDVSRIETGRLEIRREPIAWSHFVRDVVHRHHTAVSDRRFHVSVPDDDKIVTGDRDRLEQVLGNLLENAVKYSPDGSDITVTVEDKGEAFVTAVCDRGIGIPADELGQVFERFHRGRQVSSTNYGGLGLGLYITKQIIERHGGAIWVESKEGQGTRFFFSLPAAEAATLQAGGTPTQANALP
ncbi:MAG: GAF domain-containing protein [Acidobacteria bacterium]|nr:GAF domain-containing protein [Acidobacteriota bacterium]